MFRAKEEKVLRSQREIDPFSSPANWELEVMVHLTCCVENHRPIPRGGERERQMDVGY